MSSGLRFGADDTIAVIGGSIAGLTAAKELRRLGFAGRLRVLDADVHAPYRRPEVSKSMLALLEVAPTSIIDWPDDIDAERSSGFRVTSADLGARVLWGVGAADADGAPQRVDYDGLVIACGCVARTVLPVGASERVYQLRSMEDSMRLRGPLRDAREVAVVGGGFIGLEVAALAASQGSTTTVIEAGPALLHAQLGDELALSLLRRHQHLGTRFLLSEQVTDVRDDGDAVRLSTASGVELTADLVVEAVGSRPATDWVAASAPGVELEGGAVVCDEHGAVIGVDDVVAAGDVAVWTNPLYRRRMRVEHWTNAMEQAEHAAARLLGVHDPAGYQGLPYFWSNQGALKLQSLGSTWAHDEARVLRDDESSVLVEYRAEGRLVAVAGIGAARDVMRSRAALLASLRSR